MRSTSISPLNSIGLPRAVLAHPGRHALDPLAQLERRRAGRTTSRHLAVVGERVDHLVARREVLELRLDAEGARDLVGQLDDRVRPVGTDVEDLVAGGLDERASGR